MNVSAHQKEKENEIMGKREAGEKKKRQAIDFKETCSSALFREQHGKNEESTRDDWDPREANSPFDSL